MGRGGNYNGFSNYMVSILQLVCKCIHLSRVGDAVIKLYPKEYVESLKWLPWSGIVYFYCQGAVKEHLELEENINL